MSLNLFTWLKKIPLEIMGFLDTKFLTSVGVKKNNSVDERFKFENLIGKLVEIEVYDKIFNNEFSKRVRYPVARVLRVVDIPF